MQKQNSRLSHAIKESDNARLKRMESVKSTHPHSGAPLDKRKLTQQEAAAYCGVSTASIHRWKKEGLKTVKWGKLDRFMVEDLKNFMRKRQQK